MYPEFISRLLLCLLVYCIFKTHSQAATQCQSCIHVISQVHNVPPSMNFLFASYNHTNSECADGTYSDTRTCKNCQTITVNLTARDAKIATTSNTRMESTAIHRGCLQIAYLNEYIPCLSFDHTNEKVKELMKTQLDLVSKMWKNYTLQGIVCIANS